MHLTLKAVLFVHHNNSMGRPVAVRTKHIPVDRDITMADIEKMKHDFADDFFKHNQRLAQADINIVASIPYI